MTLPFTPIMDQGIHQICAMSTAFSLASLLLHDVFCCCAGEINTLQGNLNWVASREHALKHPVWEGREGEFLPLCSVAESDSANLDHMAEFMMRGGVDPQEALMVLVPEAYRNHPELASSYPQVPVLPLHDTGDVLWSLQVEQARCVMCIWSQLLMQNPYHG